MPARVQGVHTRLGQPHTQGQGHGGHGPAAVGRWGFARLFGQRPGGMGQQMDASMKMFEGAEVATMLLVFMALVWLADRISAWLRQRLA